jgi:hypothetical protein
LPGLRPGHSRVRRQGPEPRTRGLGVRCSAFPHVHRRPPVQVTVVCEPPWTVLDAGELQRKLQLRLPARGRPPPTSGAGIPASPTATGRPHGARPGHSAERHRVPPPGHAAARGAWQGRAGRTKGRLTAGLNQVTVRLMRRAVPHRQAPGLPARHAQVTVAPTRVGSADRGAVTELKRHEHPARPPLMPVRAPLRIPPP